MQSRRDQTGSLTPDARCGGADVPASLLSPAEPQMRPADVVRGGGEPAHRVMRRERLRARVPRAGLAAVVWPHGGVEAFDQAGVDVGRNRRASQRLGDLPRRAKHAADRHRHDSALAAQRVPHGVDHRCGRHPSWLAGSARLAGPGSRLRQSIGLQDRAALDPILVGGDQVGPSVIHPLGERRSRAARRSSVSAGRSPARRPAASGPPRPGDPMGSRGPHRRRRCGRSERLFVPTTLHSSSPCASRPRAWRTRSCCSAWPCAPSRRFHRLTVC